ncbi:unnamed protein product [Didymodactylos carnosus]|uniref:Major facilitator superfamily (MFS) profile domain-containing protein n=1 Tax=Didymodactylos carnosus TaxID=1234261 RepID=A0A813PVJ0_9BILA|nr:unnamed protein product [Didymodactylos carnosus]CAF0926637.1 unnamed protein product [Didymodactylos carnosus]CAF3538994.1 unnamed protein product [Didymodactylos carnosus]CAF3703655.1 unnamed protein product [Didymodactylos carnosus]
MIFAPLFGYLGDRYERKVIMIIGITLWSATTLAGSFIPSNFFILFLILRGLVGVGEASYACVAPTIIADMYKKDSRTKMLAFFNVAVPVGSGLGYIVGTNVARTFNNWQWSLRVTPVLGVICIVLLILFVDEPVRGITEGAQVQKATDWKTDIQKLIKIRSYVLSTLAFTWVSFTLGALAWWGPLFIQYGSQVSTEKEDKNITLYFGIITCTAGLLGVISGTEIARHCRKITSRADPIVCGVAILLSLPFLVVALLYSNRYMISTWISIFFSEALMCTNWALINDIMLYVVIPTRRSTASALQLFIFHFLGDAASPYIVGILSDYSHKYQENSVMNSSLLMKRNITESAIQWASLRNGLMITVPIAALSAICFLISSLFIKQDRLKAEETMKVGNSEDSTENK